MLLGLDILEFTRGKQFRSSEKPVSYSATHGGQHAYYGVSVAMNIGISILNLLHWPIGDKGPRPLAGM